MRNEIVESWRNRYAELFERRWGRVLPEPNARRFMIAHDQTWSDASMDRLRRQFGATGALIDCRPLNGEGSAWPPPADYDCLVIATMEIPGEGDRAALRGFIQELLEWSGFVAGIGGGADFLATEGLIPVMDEESRDIVEQGGRCLACSHRDQSEKIAAMLLSRLAEARSTHDGPAAGTGYEQNRDTESE